MNFLPGKALVFLTNNISRFICIRKIAKLFKRRQIKKLLLEKEVFFIFSQDISSQEKINKEKKRNANDK